MCKFYNNIKNLFFYETNKYIETINSLIEFYIHYFINDKIANIKSSKLTNLKEELNENLSKINIESNENIIFKDLISTEEILKNENEINDLDNNLNDINNKTEYSFSLNKKINSLIKNINNLFCNSIKLIISENDPIISFLKLLSEINNFFKKKMTYKSKKTTVFTSDILTQNSLSIQTNNEKSIISSEILQQIIKNEKNKLKYRLCFIKSFAIKYIIIITKIALKIFKNADEWVVKSVSKENEAQNEVINILKTKLNNIEKIDEDMEINTIEMDAFENRINVQEKHNNNNQSNNMISDLRVSPIDNTSVINSGMYNKINIDILLTDNFFDIKLKPIEIKENIPNKEIENIYDYINTIKDYELIIPKFSFINNNSIYLMSERSNLSNEEDLIKEEDFYYDIEKFFDLYQEISEFEEETNIISYNIFFETFIKNYIINDNEEIVKNEYNAIPNYLKKINIKQIFRLINLCTINIERKECNIEYETYIKMPDIFTLLSLIGSEILTTEREEKILKYFDDKFIKRKFVEKSEFMKYQFWFEKYFEFPKKNNLNNFHNNNGKKQNEKEEKINIKDFLFELWNDGNGNINLKQLLEVLKMSNYITDFIEYNGKKYYDVIFLEQ